MPLKLTAGIARKMGLPNYSSVGALCHVEVELDGGLIQQSSEAFHAQVRQLYAACAQSVDEELARQQHRTTVVTAQPTESQLAPSGNGHAADRVNGNGHLRARPSARQLEFIASLAARVAMSPESLDDLCQRLFEKSVDAISGGEASGLIRALQEIREGWIGSDDNYRSPGE
jgi:hypothetical protein